MAYHHGSRLGRPQGPSRPAVQQRRLTGRKLRVTASPRGRPKKGTSERSRRRSGKRRRKRSEQRSGERSGREAESGAKSGAESGQAAEQRRAAGPEAEKRAKRKQKRKDMMTCKKDIVVTERMGKEYGCKGGNLSTVRQSMFDQRKWPCRRAGHGRARPRSGPNMAMALRMGRPQPPLSPETGLAAHAESQAGQGGPGHPAANKILAVSGPRKSEADGIMPSAALLSRPAPCQLWPVKLYVAILHATV